MALFSSARERRLWLWTLAVVMAIYSTLGLARTLAGALREHGLLGASFPLVSFSLLAISLVGATIVTHGLNARPGGVEVAVALGVTAAYLLVFLRMASLEERSHLIEYGVVGVFIYEALAERASQARRVPALPLLAVLATAALGLLDECIQAFLPSRVFDSIRHPVQPARERDGGGCERRAGVGAAVDEVPPGAPSRRPISIAGKSWTCPPWFGCGRSAQGRGRRLERIRQDDRRAGRRRVQRATSRFRIGTVRGRDSG